MAEEHDGGQEPKIAKELLDMLACPLGHKELSLEGEELVCPCGVRFRIEEEGIPNMLVEDATLPEGIDQISDLPCQKQGAADE